MKALTFCFSSIVRIGLMLSMLFILASYTTSANAVRGYGYGYGYDHHRTVHGRAVVKKPVVHVNPVRHHPHCWKNARGQVRC